MQVLLFTILTLCALGILSAVILYFVARKFRVEEDLRIDEVEKMLPGANCGGCGFAGCPKFKSNKREKTRKSKRFSIFSLFFVIFKFTVFNYNAWAAVIMATLYASSSLHPRERSAIGAFRP